MTQATGFFTIKHSALFECGKLGQVLNMAEFSEVEKNQISLPSLYETCFKVLSSEFGLIQKKYIKGLYICKMYVLDSPNCTTRTSKLLLNLNGRSINVNYHLSVASYYYLPINCLPQGLEAWRGIGQIDIFFAQFS